MSSEPCRQAPAQVEHIALTTSDFERLCAFYSRLGTLAAHSSADPDTGLRTCVLDFCGIRLELFERRDGGRAAAGTEAPLGLLHIGFALESADAVDELTSVLAAAGHRVLEPPHRAGDLGRYESVLLDPDGNRLKLTV